MQDAGEQERCIHSISKYFLSTDYVPVSTRVLNIAANKTKSLPRAASLLEARQIQRSNQVRKSHSRKPSADHKAGEEVECRRRELRWGGRRSVSGGDLRSEQRSEPWRDVLSCPRMHFHGAGLPAGSVRRRSPGSRCLAQSRRSLDTW